VNGSFVIIAAYAEVYEANAALSRLQEGIAAFLAGRRPPHDRVAIPDETGLD